MTLDYNFEDQLIIRALGPEAVVLFWGTNFPSLLFIFLLMRGGCPTMIMKIGRLKGMLPKLISFLFVVYEFWQFRPLKGLLNPLMGSHLFHLLGYTEEVHRPWKTSPATHKLCHSLGIRKKYMEQNWRISFQQMRELLILI